MYFIRLIGSGLKHPNTNDSDDRKSTSGFCFRLGNGAISWYSKKQSTVARSSVEAEYISLGTAAAEAKWVKMFITETGLDKYLYADGTDIARKRKANAIENHVSSNAKRSKTHGTIQLYGDNQGSIALTKDPKNHSKTKHIDVQYHFIRHLAEQGDIALSYMPTGQMIADVMTKALPPKVHNRFTGALGLETIASS